MVVPPEYLPAMEVKLIRLLLLKIIHSTPLVRVKRLGNTHGTWSKQKRKKKRKRKVVRVMTGLECRSSQKSDGTTATKINSSI